MTIELQRRQFLRVLTGLIAAPAVIKADALMRVVAPKPGLAFDALGNQYEAYTSWFRMMKPVIPSDWRYMVRVANADDLGMFLRGDRQLALLAALPAHDRAEGSVAAGQLRIG